MRKPFWSNPLVAFMCLLSAVALAVGLGATSSTESLVLWQIRLPRALLAVAVGGALSLSGALLQVLFANPLCEPYTLGISSGAAFGAVLGAAVGLPAQVFGFAPGALAGAALFALVLTLIAQRRLASSASVLLSGVMLGLLGSSLVAVVMALNPEQGLQGALLWLLGDLSRAQWESLSALAPLVLLATLWSWQNARVWDALLLGREAAQSAGIDTRRTQTQIVWLTSLLVGAAVAVSGMIGFVGLMIPHLARRLGGSMHRRMIPLTVLYGATLTVLADLLARTLVRPSELPVGVVTALVGAPFFIWVVMGRRRSA